MSAIRLPTKLMDVTSSMSKNYEFGGGRIWPLLEEFKLSKPLSFLFYLYRASLISVSREFVKDVNKVIFDFIWRARTKSNTLLLLVTLKMGDSWSPTFRFYNRDSESPLLQKIGNWSTERLKKQNFLHYREPVGGKFILCCDFDLKKLPIKFSAFYDEWIKSFAKCSTANHTSLQDQNRQDLSKAFVWNNKFICVGGKSVYFRNLAEKGTLRMGDFISDNNEIFVKSNS